MQLKGQLCKKTTHHVTEFGCAQPQIKSNACSCERGSCEFTWSCLVNQSQTNPAILTAKRRESASTCDRKHIQPEHAADERGQSCQVTSFFQLWWNCCWLKRFLSSSIPRVQALIRSISVQRKKNVVIITGLTSMSSRQPKLTCWEAVVAQERASPLAALQTGEAMRSVGKMQWCLSKQDYKVPVFYCWLFLTPSSSNHDYWCKIKQLLILIHKSYLKVFILDVIWLSWCQIPTRVS